MKGNQKINNESVFVPFRESDSYDYDHSYEEEYFNSEEATKNHQVADSVILEEANAIFKKGLVFDGSGIEIEVCDQCIILSGFVEQRIEKQIAEKLVEGLSNVKDVLNQIRIKNHDNDHIKKIENLGGFDG